MSAPQQAPLIRYTGPESGPLVLFAHGAGAGPDSPFMDCFAHQLAAKGLAVVRFEFPFWTQRRITATRRPPNPQAQLDDAMARMVERYPSRPIWLMGKSMGARVAFRCADKLAVAGCIGLGFPFHPQGKPDKTRTHELFNQREGNLVVQGTHDPMGKQAWVHQQRLPSNLHMLWCSTGNHDLVPHKSSGLTAQASWQALALQVADFIKDKEWRLSLSQ